MGGIADRLAAEIRTEILAGGIPFGSSLPSERELMARFSVSRSSVREALRILDAQGLIEVRRGRGGGSLVKAPPAENIVQTLELFNRGPELAEADLLIARGLLEPAAAGLAASSRSDLQLETLGRLSRHCARLKQPIRFAAVQLDWHLALSEATGNAPVQLLLASLLRSLASSSEPAAQNPRRRKQTVGAQWQIVEAIGRRDAQAARRRMERHVAFLNQLPAGDSPV